MRYILKPIFEIITGEYVLFNNVFSNYIAMTIIGIVALKIAWNFVGRLYDLSIIKSKGIGSLIHWIIRLNVFIIVFYFCVLIIWLTKFIYKYRIIAFIVVCILIIVKTLKKSTIKNKIRQMD